MTLAGSGALEVGAGSGLKFRICGMISTFEKFYRQAHDLTDL
jgi:hypothetical protein